jgi:diacylglycerol O-acyltransferase / wax synthase
MRQLTPLDAQFLAVETSRTYGHVGGLAVYDPSTAPGGRLEGSDISRLVSERLHLLPPFRWRLVQVPLGLDLPYWTEDEDFDLDFHIRESAVPPPGDDRQLAETVARIFARPLDRSRPLWELYVIHGLEGGRVALLTKVHHAVVDGVSGNEILTVLLDPSPEGRGSRKHSARPSARGSASEPSAEDRPPRRRPGELEMLGRGLAGLPRQPLRALRSVPTALPNLTELPGANAIPGVPTLSRALASARRALGGPQDPGILEVTTARPPKTCFNGPVSAHRSFAFGSVSLDAVKAIKDEAGVKVNDVVVAVCAGAVREFLLERDELPGDPLVAMVPVSVRAEEEKGTFGNRISMMIVPIPTDVADPVQRLERAHERLRSAKELHAALPADLLTDASAFIPPAVAALAARTTVGILGRTRPPLNLVISNVPGPRSPLFIAGARLEAHYPVSAIVDGVGLNMTVMSYLDHVDFGIVADRDQIADVWPLLHAAQREVDRLVAELVGDRSEADAPSVTHRSHAR